MRTLSTILLLMSALSGSACSESGDDTGDFDGEGRLAIALKGSLQNPAWSPDGTELLLTQFENGYNKEPANLVVYSIATQGVRQLVADGSGNVNLPGAVWNSTTQQIVFSSSREPHDEIYLIDEQGMPGDERRITARTNAVAYEASLTPDGQWVVFESHSLDVEDNGVIMKFRVDGSGDYTALTPLSEDCRQPNVSPLGDRIVYQRLAQGQWDLWLVNTDGTGIRQLTSGAGDKTDASFSPDGQWIVYSSDENARELATLFIIPVAGGASVQVTDRRGYAGAPSWSPGGTKIAYEAAVGDPDGSAGTSIWLVEVPAH